MNFHEFGKREASEIELKLQECEAKLFERTINDHEIMNASENFYDDNVSFTDPCEFEAWSDSFQFIRLKGKGIGIPTLHHSEISNGTTDTKLFMVNQKFRQPLNSQTSNGLSLEGHSISFQLNQKAMTSEIEEEAMEENIEHGVLEEIIAIDKSDSSNECVPFDPSCNLREEIISLKIQQSLWPKIVMELEPLITSIVETSRRRCIVYTPETRKFHESHSSTDNFEVW